MEKVLNPFFWIFCLIAMVWFYRARRSLQALDLIPIVNPLPSAAHSGPLRKVSVILPVKNEEKNIAACLEGLKCQQGVELEVLIANDHSTDQTESLLQNLKIPRRESGVNTCHPISYLNVPETPPGWTGKNFAIHSALPYASGTWLLFTDADTRHSPMSIASAVAHTEGRNLRFLSVMPHCLAETFVEKFIQPCAMGFLGLWFPLERVNELKSKLYFANGQYLLIDRKLYDETGGHAAVRDAYLEDFALMKKAKELQARAECAMGTSLYGTRMYSNWNEIWRGWRRIYVHAFESKARVLAQKFLSVLFFSVLPFLLFIPLTVAAVENPFAYGFTWGFALMVLIFIFMPAWKTFEILRADRAYALLHPLAGFVLAMILLDATWIAAAKKTTTWR